MKTIEQIIELIPSRHKPRALKMFKEWENPSEDVANFFERHVPVLQRVDTALIDAFGCTLNDVAGYCRERHLVDLRKIVTHYLRTKENYTYSQLSKVFDRDHATAIHYVNKHTEHVKYDAKYKEKNDKFLKAINHDNESNNPTRAEDENSITTTLDILRHRAYNS